MLGKLRTSRDKRCQFTPAASHANCSALNDHVASPARGQWNDPSCKRRTHNHTPWASTQTTLIRVPARLRNT